MQAALPHLPHWRARTTPELLPTGLPFIDQLLEGFPRGRISEIVGPVSSGRTSLLNAILAAATSRGEFCALIDTHDVFDPTTGAASGIELRKLIWVRCAGDAGHAMKAADLLLHSGGFGVVALDLADLAARIANHIPISWWFRFQRAVENTSAVFVLLGTSPHARSCAAVQLDMRQERAVFSGKFRLMRGIDYSVALRKPVRPDVARFQPQAHLAG